MKLNDIVFLKENAITIEPYIEWRNLPKINSPRVIYGRLSELEKYCSTSSESFIYISTYNGDGGIHRYDDLNYQEGCTFNRGSVYRYDDIFNKCFHLFGTNINLVHDKCTCLPYGFTSYGSVVEFPTPKDNLCYSRFTIDNCWHYRKPAYDESVKRNYIYSNFTPPSNDNLNEHMSMLRRSKFAICPPGNGPDTYRVWEALYARCIPIVLDWDIYRNFIDLPILRLNSYSEITEDFLNTKYEEFINKEWNYDKLKLSYWHQQFYNTYIKMIEG